MFDAANEGSRELLEGAVSWLLAQRNGHGNSVFPYFSAPGQGPVQADSRLAWCYGDLGIATVVLLAARAAGRADWELEALRVAEHAARRPFCESGVEDGMFCHGAAGNAHLFNRLYQATRHPGLRHAAQHWYERTLDYSDPANGPTGYVCVVRDPPDAPTDETEIIAAESYGLAVGVAGVALVLLAGIGRVAPDWDRALAIAVDPAQSAGEMQRAI